MPCDSWRRSKNQTLTERKIEVKKVLTRLDQLLAARQVSARVGPQGAIAFEGWSTEDRAGVRDACAYRQIMQTGSTLARLEIARAEQMAGRSVDRQIIGQGVHSHDNGNTWHGGHK
jgi:hypothetical protein